MEPGELVKLKSGGPMMTVEGNADADRVTCAYFAGAELRRVSLRRDNLVPFQLDEGGNPVPRSGFQAAKR